MLHSQRFAGTDAAPPVAILLAAGKGSRFDPSGQASKLLAPTAPGVPVAALAARHLIAAIARVIAVVRPDQPAIAALLRSEGCQVVTCTQADNGMSASLACGIRATGNASGYLIALADMPFVQTQTIAALVSALTDGADIAAPVCDGRRGNPVIFSVRHRQDLLLLKGDAGARQLLQRFPFRAVPVHDKGIFKDIDRPEDLQPC